MPSFLVDLADQRINHRFAASDFAAREFSSRRRPASGRREQHLVFAIDHALDDRHGDASRPVV